MGGHSNASGGGVVAAARTNNATAVALTAPSRAFRTGPSRMFSVSSPGIVHVFEPVEKRRGMERIAIGETTIEALVAGDGPPLLFLHGLDYFAQHRPFLDRLAQHFRVIAPRHPGFGASSRPPWMRGVGDIAYLYLDLLDRLALDDVLLVGASFGGWVAMELAVRSTARLYGLVLIDALGVKFGGRDEVEIADIYALPADEAVRRTFAHPAKAPDYDSLHDAAVQEVARDRQAAVLYGRRPLLHNPRPR